MIALNDSSTASGTATVDFEYEYEYDVKDEWFDEDDYTSPYAGVRYLYHKMGAMVRFDRFGQDWPRLLYWKFAKCFGHPLQRASSFIFLHRRSMNRGRHRDTKLGKGRWY